MVSIVGSVIGVIGLVTCVVSTALDYWYLLSDSAAHGSPYKIYFGLWETCEVTAAKSGDYPVKQCVFFSTINEFEVDGEPDIKWLHACQACMIVACISLGLGVLYGFLFSTLYTSNRQMKNTAGTMCFLAGCCTLAAAVMFMTFYEDLLGKNQTGGHLHAGFWMAIATSVLSLLGGIAILINKAEYTTIP